MVLDPSFSFKKIFPSILLILVVGIIVYVNSFHVPFVLDDDWTIVKNPIIRSLDNFYANPTGYEFLPNRYVATLSLAIAARAHAFLRHRPFVTPDDIKAIALDVLRHRVMVTYEAEAEEITSEDVIRRVFEHIPVP